MKKTLLVFVASTLLAAAGVAAPQAPTPAPSSAQSPEPAATKGSPLKLRLEDASPSRPRITFGPREGEQGAASNLPSLGPSPTHSIDPASGSWSPSGSSPFPKDTERQYR